MTAIDKKSHHRENIGKNQRSKENEDFANIDPRTRELRKLGLTFQAKCFQFLKNNCATALYITKTDSPLESFFSSLVSILASIFKNPKQKSESKLSVQYFFIIFIFLTLKVGLRQSKIFCLK